MTIGTGLRFAAALALLFVGIAGGDALAQRPDAAKGEKGTSAAAAPGDTATAAQDLRRELAAAQAEVDAIEASGPGAGAPPGTPASESSERRTLARQLVTVLQQQLDRLERTSAATAARAAAERADREWAGFPGTPPWPVTMTDAIRSDLEAAESRIAAAVSRRALLERFGTDIESRLKASQAAARQAAEAAEAGRGTPQSARLEWTRELAAQRARADVASVTVKSPEQGLDEFRERSG